MRLIILSLFFIVANVSAEPVNYTAANKCIVIYSLNGLAQNTFSQQVEQLKAHLLRQRIGLIDLNSWPATNTSPQLSVSGREKSILRQKFALPDIGNHAVLLNHRAHLIGRYKGTVDLVNIMLDCQ